MALLQPIARGIQTLEGNNATCADVFNVWIGIGLAIDSDFANPDTPAFRYRQTAIAAYNHRFAIMMKDSTADVFILAYFLNPCQSRLLSSVGNPH